MKQTVHRRGRHSRSESSVAEGQRGREIEKVGYVILRATPEAGCFSSISYLFTLSRNVTQ